MAVCVVGGSVLIRGTMGTTHDDGVFAVFLWLLLARNSLQLGVKVGVLPFVEALFKGMTVHFQGTQGKIGLRNFWAEPWPRELCSGLISITSHSQRGPGLLLATAPLGMLTRALLEKWHQAGSYATLGMPLKRPVRA